MIPMGFFAWLAGTWYLGNADSTRVIIALTQKAASNVRDPSTKWRSIWATQWSSVKVAIHENGCHTHPICRPSHPLQLQCPCPESNECSTSLHESTFPNHTNAGVLLGGWSWKSRTAVIPLIPHPNLLRLGWHQEHSVLTGEAHCTIQRLLRFWIRISCSAEVVKMWDCSYSTDANHEQSVLAATRWTIQLGNSKCNASYV